MPDLPTTRRHVRAIGASTTPSKVVDINSLNYIRGARHATQPKPAQGAAMSQLDPTQVGGRVMAMREWLKGKVVGQSGPLDELISCWQRWAAGLATPNRPMGIYLLVGPTGSGKTLVAKAFAEAITGTPQALVRIDCGELAHSHEVARLIGAPAGYLGHRETAALLGGKALYAHCTPEQPVSIILLDELDKAHPRVLDLFLGIFDAGRLTLGDNTTVDFSSTIILATANTGANELQDMIAPRFGLVGPTQDIGDTAAASEGYVRKGLRPEFFNRLDKVLAFNQLSKEEVAAVLELELIALQTRLATNSGIALAFNPAAKELIVNEGLDLRYGARHLKRAIRVLLEAPLANLIVSGEAKRGDTIDIDAAGGVLTFNA